MNRARKPFMNPDISDTKTGACPPSVRADLKAFSDNELSYLRRAYVARHLRTCPECREELNEMKKITDLFAAASSDANQNAAFAPHLRSRVLAGLDNAAPTPAASANSPVVRLAPLWRRKPALVFGGGGSVLAASLALFFTMNPAHRTETPTNAVGLAAPAPYAQEYEDFAAAKSSAPGAAPAAVSAGAVSAGAAPARSSRPVIVPGSVLRGRPESAVANSAAASSAVSDTVAKPNLTAAPPVPGVYGRNAGEQARESEPAFSDTSDTDDGRKVHKNASLGLHVAAHGLQAASDKVEALVKSTGGYVASNNLTTDEQTGEKSADLTVRVPVQDFESVMSALSKMGDVVAKQVTGEDITDKTLTATTSEQVLLNEAKTTERKLEQQSMSEKRTGQKEAELRQIRMQLAQTRARLGMLRKMAALSTINVTLTEKPVKKAAVVPASGFLSGMQETNRAAMQAFQTAVRVPLVLIVWILAFSPIWVPLILAYRWASLKTLASRVAGTQAGGEGSAGG